MKRLLLVGLLSLLLCSADAQFTKATLQATGLTCAMCSNAINKALQQLDFVETVRSDIKNSSFSIQFRNGKEVRIDAIREAVEDAGFSVGGLKLTGLFQDIKLEKNRHLSFGNEHFLFMNGDGQTLQGEREITVVDRNFLSEKQFRKWSSGNNKTCLSTGKAGPDCVKDGLKEGDRVYHVTI